MVRGASVIVLVSIATPISSTGGRLSLEGVAPVLTSAALHELLAVVAFEIVGVAGNNGLANQFAGPFFTALAVDPTYASIG